MILLIIVSIYGIALSKITKETYYCRCNGSVDKILYQFISQVDEFICSTSLLFVCDWSIRPEVKSNWLTG